MQICITGRNQDRRVDFEKKKKRDERKSREKRQLDESRKDILETSSSNLTLQPKKDPLSGLDCSLGTEVGVRVVGCTDSVFSHSPGLEESLQCLRAELWPIIAGEVFRNSKN